MTHQEREEYELVAKACGLKVKFSGKSMFVQRGWCDWIFWNPKTDSGDSFRVMVSLDLHAIYIRFINLCLPDKEEATRLAIWRAAVEYAKGLK